MSGSVQTIGVVSGGRRRLEIELAPDDLVALTAAVLAPLSSAG
jgi:prolyl-tRNA editing enzyme YbaK/EbsC (Cys-tRNA(Pro) deacylase)